MPARFPSASAPVLPLRARRHRSLWARNCLRKVADLECSLLEISSLATKSCKKDQKVHKAIENGHLYWIYPLKMVIFHSYVSLPEGKSLEVLAQATILGLYSRLGPAGTT